MSLMPRHEGHLHTVNLKYGYFIVFVSALHAASMVWASYSYLKFWRKNGEAPPAKRFQPPLYVAVLAWALLIVLTTVWYVPLPEHYTTAVKRMGRIAYVLVPFDLFLAFRPSNSYIFNYLAAIDLHKWVSRIIIVLGCLHGLGFTVKWLVEGVFFAKVLQLDNFLGLVAATLLFALIVVSVRFFRRRVYKWFYVFHNLSMFVFIVAIGFHARPGVFMYAVSCLAILAFQVWLRSSQSSKINSDELTVISTPGSSLSLVRIPKLYFEPWTPASHIRLSINRTLLDSYVFPGHAYTIASTIDDDTLDLIVKRTRNVSFGDASSRAPTYTVAGPFPSLPEPFFVTAESVTIICGGSGISFGIPILKGVNSNADVNLIWCVRTKEDLHILRALDIDEKITVFVTQNGGFTDEPSDEARAGLLAGEEGDDSANNFELHDLDEEDSNPTSKATEATKQNITIRQGRPDFDELFSSIPLSENTKNTWLVACGPESLLESTKKWTQGKSIGYVSELYEF